MIAESFERIHRSNLVGMGVLPLTFKDGASRKTLALDGSEVLDIRGLAGGIKPRQDVPVTITRADGRKDEINAAVPDRHPRRGRLLPPRRHPALRPAPAARAGRARRPRRLRR